MPKPNIEPVAKTSENIAEDNLSKLREVFPEFVKDGQVDFDALQAFFNKEGYLAGEEKYGLSWAGKRDAYKAIRVPATGTLTPQPEESKNWDATENIFIEGDNLEVLKLLQKHYREKIKMIYIDPPYNTGKDFIYKDNFSESTSDYYERTGQSEDGIRLTANPESNGRYHSDWLTMMYPRLFLARNLLREDGAIFISIDDNEAADLRLVMDEIFGEKNLIAQIVRRRRASQANLSKNISPIHEYILVYGKTDGIELNKVQFESTDDYKNADNDPRGPYVTMPCSNRGGSRYIITTPNGDQYEDEWRFPELTFKQLLADGRIVFPRGGSGKPRYKLYLAEKQESGVLPNTWWDQDTNQEASGEVEQLMGGFFFDNPKPVSLLRKILQMGSGKEDFTLDFFAGSGTTAHAVMAQNAVDGGNRKWICVQLPEETVDDSAARNAGYKTIADISRERIRRAGAAIGKGDVGFKSLKLERSNYRQWTVLTNKDDERKFLEQSKLFVEKPLVDDYDEKSVVYEILEKEGLDLNAVVKQEKINGINVWVVTDAGRRLLVSFEKKLSKEQVESLDLRSEDTFVCLDSALDDTTKVNIGREFKVKVI